MIDLSVLGQVSETALTREAEIGMTSSGLPNTFVPGRNLLFLGFAAAVAYRRGARHLVTGVCETIIPATPTAATTASGDAGGAQSRHEARFAIHTPLMWRDKAATWALAEELGGAPLVELVRKQTHSCYKGDREHHHAWGFGCGDCPACELRARGWESFHASRADPA
jgi:7-cyano-7-deazaguanine synthase